MQGAAMAIGMRFEIARPEFAVFHPIEPFGLVGGGL
jgi:hypothetical protein